MCYYCSYSDYMLRYDELKNSFSIFCGSKIVEDARLEGLYLNNELVYDMSYYNSHSISHSSEESRNTLNVSVRSDKSGVPSINMQFFVDNSGIILRAYNFDDYTLKISGAINYGEYENIFAVNTDRVTEDLRSAIGPAASTIDNAVYDKKTDTAFSIENCRDLRLKYDFDLRGYRFCISTSNRGFTENIFFSVKKDILTKKYSLDFSPMKSRFGQSTPRAGWMTWYAVKFDACEETVLKNVDFQEKNLKKFGADTIWIDWEWCHKKFESRRSDGVDVFHPDPKKYPNGLGFIADKIKEAGFAPALWIGFTNDLSDNEFTQKNPDIILAEEETWCGTYFYDFSNPKYLNEFLPKAIQNVKDWGYEIIKYDTLTVALLNHERFHKNMYNPDLSSKEAFRGMVKQARKLLGEDTYMLSCACLCDANILWGADVFDAARVGRDVFLWQEFTEECVEKVKRYYPLHNIILHTDPDNLVLRDEFSTFDQAVSRVSFVSLLGLPLTFGDDLPQLPENRVNLIKRALPVLDIHPMSLDIPVSDRKTQIVNLSVCIPFEEYNVVDILNTTESKVDKWIDLSQDLHLEKGEYLVYDYFNRHFEGVFSSDIKLDLEPCASKVLCIRRKLDRPQIVSTSRHITQGAAELKAVNWNNNTLIVSADLVADDPYTITLYVPENYQFKGADNGEYKTEKHTVDMTFVPTESKTYEFNFDFNYNE